VSNEILSSPSAVRNLDLALIDPDPDQPRKTFSAIDELAASIEANGLIEPIVVTPRGDRFMVLVGERRLRAVTFLGWPSIPALVDERALTVSQRLEIQTAENDDRDTLNLADRMAAGVRAWRLSGIDSLKEYCASIGRPASHVSKFSAALNHLTARSDDTPQLRTLREEASAATQDGRLCDPEAIPLLFKVEPAKALKLLRAAKSTAPLSRITLKAARKEAAPAKEAPPAPAAAPRLRTIRIPEDLLQKVFERLGIAYDPQLAPAEQISSHFALESC